MNAWLKLSRWDVVLWITNAATSPAQLITHAYSCSPRVAGSFETDPSVRSPWAQGAPVRPGPWRRSVSRHENLGRVNGGAYERAKTLNARIVDGAELAMECLKASRTKTTSERIASKFLVRLECEIKSAGAGTTFVNVSTATHRVGVVIGASGAGERVLQAHASFLGRLGTLLHQHQSEFGPRQLANIFWGLGKCGQGIRQLKVTLPIALPYPPTMDDVIRMLLKQVKYYRARLRPVNFSNVFLGLAYLDYKRCKRFKIACAPHVKSSLSKFSPQQLSNFTWALSKLKFTDKIGLIPAIAQTSFGMVSEFAPRELCGLMQGMSGLGYSRCRELFDFCMPVMQKQLSFLSAREAYTLIAVLSNSRYHPGDAVLEAATKHISSQLLSGQHGLLAAALMNLAHFGHTSAPLVLAGAHFLKSNIPSTKYQARDVCNVLWALTMLDSLQKEHIICARGKLGKFESGALMDVELNQLHQCEVHAKLFDKGCSEGSESALLQSDLARRCRSNWVECQERQPLPSTLKDVEYVLKGMGYTIQDKWIEAAALKVRMVSCIGREDGLVLELITGWRCFVNDRNLLSGSYLWREKVLTALGETVLRVDEEAFKKNELRTDKEKYLASLLGEKE